jgi:YspA, cpYpsA-related SLOG family
MTAHLVVLVCGGRDYADRAHVYGVLDEIHAKHTAGIEILRHGGARGADELAGIWARANGVAEDKMPADWARHGRRAGPIRNAAMLVKEPPPSVVIAFPGGRGTDDMVSRAMLVVGLSVVVNPRRP